MAITNLKQLEAAINKRIAKALQNDVAPVVQKVMQEKVREEVYQVYSPVSYSREMDHGGLSDIANMEATMIHENTLSVENVRSDGARNVAEIVETGEGYQYDSPVNGVPRPFTEATREELRNTNEHVHALYKGLQKQGINVKR